MRLTFVSQAVAKSFDAQGQTDLQRVGTFVNEALRSGAASIVKKELQWNQQIVQKTFSPEEQAGLQNIAALINQMLQSGMATAQPESAEDAGHQVAMSLQGDQQNGRIGGPAPNEDIGKIPPGASPKDKADEETKKAPTMNMKKMASVIAQAIYKAFQEQEVADGAESTGFSGHQNKDAPFQQGGHPAGKGEDSHPGTDASDAFEDRLEDIPVYDEENAEGVQQGSDISGGEPGKGSPAKPGVSKMQLLRMLAKQMGYDTRTLAKALSINYDREVQKDNQMGMARRLQYLERTLETLAGTLAPIVGLDVNKAMPRDRRPVFSSEDVDHQIILKALAKELGIGVNKSADDIVGDGQPRTREAVYKSLGGLLNGMEGQGVWQRGADRASSNPGDNPEGWPTW